MMATRDPRLRQHVAAQQPDIQTRARWTTGLTKIFADLIVDQVLKGNRQSSNSFGTDAWKTMCSEFYKLTGLKWDKEQLKSRYSLMKKQHAIMKSILNKSEFRLDESTGNIVATNDAWDRYIKAHPDAETIKGDGCPIYKQLGVIFSEPLTNGKHVHIVEQEEVMPSSVFYEDPLYGVQGEVPLSVSLKDPFTNVQGVDSTSESEDEDDAAEEQDSFQPLPARHITTPVMPRTTALENPAATNRKRGRRGTDDAIAAAISHMAAASRLRTAAIMKVGERYSIADCIKELDAMQGVEERIYFAALDMFDNRNAREIFLSLKGDKRMIWLKGKCTAHQTL